MSKKILIFITIFSVWGYAKAQNVLGVCYCVPIGTCNNNTGGGGTGADGSGNIDIRIQTNGVPATGSGTTLQITTPAGSGITPSIITQTVCGTNLERCCPTAGYACGLRYPPISGSRAPTLGQAAYGSYPWQGVILAPGDIFQGSGALIDHLHVVTSAHRVNEFLTNGRQLKLRFGEWDASSSTEPIAPQEFNVARIFVHPQYNAQNLRNNIAILRLATPVNLGQVPTITTACLPSSLVNTNIRCWVAGWGRNDFTANGQYQAIQKEVDVPIVDQTTCQNQLRLTRLGANFQLDFPSFVCAGGEAGKDACTGDGGSPLVCQIVNQWYVVGLVAWGIGCGQQNVPGVYVNVANYISWIQQTTRS